MKFTKNICVICLCAFSLLMMNFGFCLTTPNDPVFPDSSSTPRIESVEIEEIEKGPKSFSDKLKGILNLNIPQKEEYNTSLGYALSLIKILVNWILGILAFVALIYMLYCGFLVLSSDDKNVSKGKKGISTAAIAIAGIGLSWLIISAMIWFIELIAESN